MVIKGKYIEEKVPVFSAKEHKKPLFVLLVEDDRGDALLARRTVYTITETKSEYEYYLDSTPSLQEALEALKGKKYAAVLLDLSLVDADGVEAVDALKKHFPTMPIIILTNNESRHTKLDATVKGVEAYLYKRHMKENPEVVADALDRAIRKSPQTSDNVG